VKVVYTEQAKKDLLSWQKNDIKKITRIETLLKAIHNHPFNGIGKPEPLRFEYQGYWS
jgi:toxin YoeB